MKELAQHIRSLDMLQIPMADLAAWCQAFGRSGRGTREELQERLYHLIWAKQYDNK